MGRTMKMTTLPKIVDILNSVLLNNPTIFFIEKEKMYMGSESPRKRKHLCTRRKINAGVVILEMNSHTDFLISKMVSLEHIPV